MKLAERPAAQMKLVGGRVCLDFVNTVGGREPSESAKLAATSGQIRADKLADYDDLLAWSWHAGLLSETSAQNLAREAVRRQPEAAAIWRRAVALREALYRLCRAQLHHLSPLSADLETLNQELNIAHGRVRVNSAAGYFVWEWTDSKNALDQMLWRIADAAAEMLTADDLTRLRECPGESCGWLFLDVSKNNRRQWCDMQTCGNVAKVRRFRARSASAKPAAARRHRR